MSKVELRLNELINGFKYKMDEIRKLSELEKAFLDDELEVNHNEQMFTQFKGDKYDFELFILEQMFEELGYKRRADIDVIVYFQKFGLHYFKIIFDLSEKIVDLDTNFERTEIEDDLLKAIDKQAKELGWI